MFQCHAAAVETSSENADAIKGKEKTDLDERLRRERLTLDNSTLTLKNFFGVDGRLFYFDRTRYVSVLITQILNSLEQM
jgi:hypothetical protein